MTSSSSIQQQATGNPVPQAKNKLCMQRLSLNCACSVTLTDSRRESKGGLVGFGVRHVKKVNQCAPPGRSL